MQRKKEKGIVHPGLAAHGEKQRRQGSSGRGVLNDGGLDVAGVPAVRTGGEGGQRATVRR
jgi:hypothetical protein